MGSNFPPSLSLAYSSPLFLSILLTDHPPSAFCPDSAMTCFRRLPTLPLLLLRLSWKISFLSLSPFYLFEEEEEEEESVTDDSRRTQQAKHDLGKCRPDNGSMKYGWQASPTDFASQF